MKRIFAVALTVCLLISALCVTALAADPISSAVNECNNCKMGNFTLTSNNNVSEKDILEILNGSYVELAIAIAALIATVVSVILIATSDKRKEASRLKKKKTEENKKN